MQLRELISGRVVLDDVSVFATAVRPYNGGDPELSICMYQSGREAKSLLKLELDRAIAIKLIRELSDALAVQPYSPQEIAHHEAVVAERKAEGANI